MHYTDSTPREDYTISGKTFQVIQPYSEGHKLTAGEASQLNQVFAENIRNNFSSTVEDSDGDVEVLQSKLDDYMSSYEMGIRRSGGRTGDPVRAEFMAIAKDKVREKLRKQGKKLKDYKSSDITEIAAQYWESRHDKAAKVLALAEKRVAERQELAEVELNELAA